MEFVHAHLVCAMRHFQFALRQRFHIVCIHKAIETTKVPVLQVTEAAPDDEFHAMNERAISQCFALQQFQRGFRENLRIPAKFQSDRNSRALCVPEVRDSEARESAVHRV